ncbi:MAG TPA: hypothetical protein VF438_02295 [Candidatus Paceibacterota bacterium]
MQFFKHLSAPARALAVISTLLVLILVFWAGMAVGHKQAEFGYRSDKNYVDVFYSKNSPFAGRPGSQNRIGMMERDSLPNGAAGKIVAINLPTVAIIDPSSNEKVIMISAETIMRKGRADATSTDLRIGDIVTAIGSPDAQGRVLATFIRIMPLMSTTTAPVPPASQR